MKQKKRILSLAALSLCLSCMGMVSCSSKDNSVSSGSASAHEHSYVTESEKKATCTEKGSKTERCSICGKEKSETIAALGHALGEWKQKSKATCKEAEVLERSCTREGCKESETKEGEAALGHDWGEWVTEGDKMTRTCKREGCEGKQEQAAPMVRVYVPEAGTTPYTTKVENYLKAEDPDVADYACSDEGNQGYKIGWISSFDNVTSYRVECSKTEDFASCETITAGASATEAYVYNLEKAATYYIRVVAIDADGEHFSAVSTFETSDLGPRVMKVDGIHNVRDVGGYMTSEGRTLQGKIIRGGALSPSTFEAYKNINISEEGKKYMSETLKIKTDFDLRTASENRSPDSDVSSGLTVSPIPGAKLEYHTANGYLSIFTEKTNICDVFKSLSDETKYPVYLHCTGGADRTGTYSFLINALLGVSEKDLIHDYEYTSFSLYGERNSKTETPYQFKPMLEKLKSDYEGDSLKEKVENFLLSQGVTETQIYNLRAIMHGQPTKEEEKPATVTYNPGFEFTSGSINLDSSNPTATSTLGGYDGQIYSAKVKETCIDATGCLFVFMGSYGFCLRGEAVRYSEVTSTGYNSDCYIGGKRETGGSISSASLKAGTIIGLSATIKDDSTRTLSIYENNALVVSYDYPKTENEIASSEARFTIGINTAKASACVISSPNE